MLSLAVRYVNIKELLLRPEGERYGLAMGKDVVVAFRRGIWFAQKVQGEG